MSASAVNPGHSDSLLSLRNQSSVLQLAASQSGSRDLSPQDVVSISDTARKAHAASDLLDADSFSTTNSAGPPPADSTPFQNVVAAIQYQQVQSLLQTGTTFYSPSG